MRFVSAVLVGCLMVAGRDRGAGRPRRPTAPGGLSEDEAKMVAFVDANNDAALKTLEQVVNINSGTQNFAGVREVGKIFQQEFDALGFKTQWVDGALFKRAGHLVAEHAGPGPKLLLIGHLDTVFEPNSPFQKFERVDARYAKGPGIIDMKGGNVVMVHALKALQSVGALKTMNIIVVLTGDEEDAGQPLALARAPLVAAAKGATAAIGFEDGPGKPETAVVSRRGTTTWTLKVKGQPAHSSQIFRADIGAGAIFEAARVLNAFREKLSTQPHLTFNPGTIVGGTSVEHDPVQTTAPRSGRPTSSPSTPSSRATCGRSRRNSSPPRRSRWRRSSRRRCRIRSPRSHSKTAIRRWRRPTGTGSCSRCTTGRARMWVPARSRPSTRIAPVRPTFRSSPAK